MPVVSKDSLVNKIMDISSKDNEIYWNMYSLNSWGFKNEDAPYQNMLLAQYLLSKVILSRN